MALRSLFVCGPRRSGKSTIIQQLTALHKGPRPHYMRLSAAEGDKRQPQGSTPPEQDCGVASARWITYEPERAFEVIPDALTKIHRIDRSGVVIIEANADPLLRHAFPYDFRLFVMPVPHCSSEVFRTHDQAAEALTAALNDTAAFAGEIFGLVEENGEQFDDDCHEERSALTRAQMRGLMSSPLGDELATRILLQPSYHGLIESDIVLVNRGVGGQSDEAERALHNLDRVMAHFRRHNGHRHAKLICCDPADASDGQSRELLDMLVEALWKTDGNGVA